MFLRVALAALRFEYLGDVAMGFNVGGIAIYRAQKTAQRVLLLFFLAIEHAQPQMNFGAAGMIAAAPSRWRSAPCNRLRARAALPAACEPRSCRARGRPARCRSSALSADPPRRFAAPPRNARAPAPDQSLLRFAGLIARSKSKISCPVSASITSGRRSPRCVLRR